jgi:hypothetical protein
MLAAGIGWHPRTVQAMRAGGCVEVCSGDEWLGGRLLRAKATDAGASSIPAVSNALITKAQQFIRCCELVRVRTWINETVSAKFQMCAVVGAAVGGVTLDRLGPAA